MSSEYGKHTAWHDPEPTVYSHELAEVIEQRDAARRDYDIQAQQRSQIELNLVLMRAHAKRLADALKRSENHIYYGRTSDAVSTIREALAQWEALNQ